MEEVLLETQIGLEAEEVGFGQAVQVSQLLDTLQTNLATTEFVNSFRLLKREIRVALQGFGASAVDAQRVGNHRI